MSLEKPHTLLKSLKMLNYIVDNIKNNVVETYDISSELVDQIFNHLDLSGSQYIIDTSKINHIDEIPVGWDKDTCGHVIERTSNGHRIFCGVPKNEHFTVEKNSELAHRFVSKTSDDIRYEMNYLLYKKDCQSQIDTITQNITNQIDTYITEHFERHMFKVSNTKSPDKSPDEVLIKLNKLIKRYKNYCFKSNFVEYFDDVGYYTFYVLKKHRYLIVNLDDDNSKIKS